MVINSELLFIHIPKTGGTSCTDYLCQTLRGPVFCSSIKHQDADMHHKAFLFEGYSHETLAEIYSDRDQVIAATGIDPTMLRHVFAVVRDPYELELSNYLFFSQRSGEHSQGGAFQVPIKALSFSMGRHPQKTQGYHDDIVSNENGLADWKDWLQG